MGNPYQKKRLSAKANLAPVPFNARNLPGREMNLLPVPITAADGGQVQENVSLASSLRRQFPHVLLIECLLEKMCTTYETDPLRQQELFKALRTYFVNFRLLPPHEGFPEMDSVRIRLGADLNNLFRLARIQISRQPPSSPGTLAVLSSPFSGSVWSSMDGGEHLFTSRYELDFKEIEFIASGGFGAVYKARNNLDNNEYAIKKIVISGPQSARKMIREVQLLSLLHHPNIVAYKSAWLEYCSPQTLHEIVRRMDVGASFSSHGVSVVSRFATFSEEFSQTVRTRSAVASSHSSDSVVFESDTVTETSSSFAASHHREEMTTDRSDAIATRSLVLDNYWRFNTNRVTSSPMLLYIQMQLCAKTLRQWLTVRNASIKDRSLKEIDVEKSLFRQIVSGVQHIHSHNIIHRDIKPENIFIDESKQHVQIGDFGLAKLGLSREPDNGTSLVTASPKIAHLHTRGVGTHSYAAPEQLNSREFDAKSDIYSLGIVFLELLVPFRTEMERHKAIENLRKCNELPKMVYRKWPRMAKLILKMISLERSCRPSADEIIVQLDTEQSAPCDDVDGESVAERRAADGGDQRTVPELLSIIEDLRRQLAEKIVLIEELTKSNCT